MKRFGMTAVAMALAAGLVSQANADQTSVRDDDRKVTLVGCAVKGTGDGDGFLLANNVEQTTMTTVAQNASGGATVSSTTATQMGAARIIYWLDDDDDVTARLMGQLIEVTGEIEGDVERGKIEIERENGMIELEINADGRKANVKLADVPSAVGTAGSVRDRERELTYTVRKLDVKSARSIAPTCR
jgi:hypothetical protein